MATSLREHHPDAQITVLVIDGGAGECAAGSAEAVLSGSELLGDRWGLIAGVNPPGALTMAALPHLLRHLLAVEEEPVLYVGAGVRILDRLDDLVGAQSLHDLVLVARPRLVTDTAEGAQTRESAYSHQLLGFGAGSVRSGVLDIWPTYFAVGSDDGAQAAITFVDALPARVFAGGAATGRADARAHSRARGSR
jgi:hypothetical protein